MAYKEPLLSDLSDPNDKGTEIEINTGTDTIILTLKEKLGEGAFASVYKAFDNRGKPFAVKTISCQNMQAYYSITEEINILLRLRDPNIVRMYAFDYFNTTALLVMEYCKNGTLNDRLRQPVDNKMQYTWLAQLASGMLYLHGHDIVHRDLKTENILISENNDIKISDFGISREFACVKNGNDMERDQNDYLSQYLHAFMGTFAGTPFWVAPEVFDLKYNEKADIFSLGVIFHSILERQSCRFDSHEYFGVFVDHYGKMVGIGLAMFEKKRWIDPTFNCAKNEKLQKLVRNMLAFNPEERLTLEAIKIEINDIFTETFGFINNHEEEGENRISCKLLKEFCCCCCYKF